MSNMYTNDASKTLYWELWEEISEKWGTLLSVARSPISLIQKHIFFLLKTLLDTQCVKNEFIMCWCIKDLQNTHFQNTWHSFCPNNLSIWVLKNLYLGWVCISNPTLCRTSIYAISLEVQLQIILISSITINRKKTFYRQHTLLIQSMNS